jgi:hypothetical protein
MKRRRYSEAQTWLEGLQATAKEGLNGSPEGVTRRDRGGCAD